jgi:hypothetical protein
VVGDTAVGSDLVEVPARVDMAESSELASAMGRVMKRGFLRVKEWEDDAILQTL